MPTLNQRRRETTRQEIAEAALRLFARNGYARVTAEAIAEESGVSLRTFYRYFSAKDDVLRPTVEVRAQNVVDALAARPLDESLPVAVQRAMEQLNPPVHSAQPSPFIRVLIETPELVTRWLRDLALFEEPLAPVVQQRLGPSCTDEHARYTTAVIVTALRIAFERSLDQQALDRYPEMVGEVLSYFGAGAGLSSAEPPTVGARPRRPRRPTTGR